MANLLNIFADAARNGKYGKGWVFRNRDSRLLPQKARPNACDLKKIELLKGCDNSFSSHDERAAIRKRADGIERGTLLGRVKPAGHGG